MTLWLPSEWRHSTGFHNRHRLYICREISNHGETGGGLPGALLFNGMYIGHINLAKSIEGRDEHFVELVKAIQARGVQQYVLVGEVRLAKQLDKLENVTVGPVVRTAVTACCLMPAVDVVHVHDPSDGQSGLLLTLTRSIPFVLTQQDKSPARSALAKAVNRRAAGMVYENDGDAAKHLRIYRHAVSNWRSSTSAL